MNIFHCGCLGNRRFLMIFKIIKIVLAYNILTSSASKNSLKVLKFRKAKYVCWAVADTISHNHKQILGAQFIQT